MLTGLNMNHAVCIGTVVEMVKVEEKNLQIYALVDQLDKLIQLMQSMQLTLVLLNQSESLLRVGISNKEMILQYG